MKYHFYVFLFMVSFLFLSSCQLPEGVSIGPIDNTGQETIKIELNKVALKFDFSTGVNTSFIMGDYGEFITAHNAIKQDWSNCSGTIDNLANILWNEDLYDTDHKPSITVDLFEAFNNESQVHNCKKGDVTYNTVFGIPYVRHLNKVTIKIKSIKTRDNGVQIVWEKTAFKDNWPINEFIKDGKVYCENSSITKVGTNNDNGNVAVRGNTIITNTSNKIITKEDDFILDEKQLISPDLCKPVLLNGSESTGAQWSKPVIYKEIKL